MFKIEFLCPHPSDWEHIREHLLELYKARLGFDSEINQNYLMAIQHLADINEQIRHNSLNLSEEQEQTVGND